MNLVWLQRNRCIFVSKMLQETEAQVDEQQEEIEELQHEVKVPRPKLRTLASRANISGVLLKRCNSVEM